MIAFDVYLRFSVVVVNVDFLWQVIVFDVYLKFNVVVDLFSKHTHKLSISMFHIINLNIC